MTSKPPSSSAARPPADDVGAPQVWRAVSFGIPGGALVDMWRVAEPFEVPRLPGEFEARRRHEAAQTAKCDGALIDYDLVTVDGRDALRRVERLPKGAGYAGMLIIPLDAEFRLEVAITCSEYFCRKNALDGDTEPEEVARQLTETVGSNLRIPGPPPSRNGSAKFLQGRVMGVDGENTDA